MRHEYYAMPREHVEDYAQIGREMWEAAKSMSRADRHDAVEEIYAAEEVYRLADAEDEPYDITPDGVAHIAVVGMLTPRANPCAALLGDGQTEYGFIREAVMRADDDPNVAAIALDIDSPGGSVSGLDETAMIVAQAKKPTRSYVHNMAASAAYWLAAQTDEIIATSPSSVVGSIGVAVETLDTSKAEADQGVVRRTFTSTDAPDKRVDASTEEGQAKIVAHLDDLHALFVRRVARGRNVSAETVNADFGRGGVVIAEKAMKVGMIDRVIDIESEDVANVVDSAPVAGSGMNMQTTSENIVVDEKPKSISPADEAGQREVPMTKELLKTEHPDLFNALSVDFGDAGVQSERARVMRLRSYVDADPDNVRLAEVINEAIASGSSADDIDGKIQVAIRDGKALEGENAPAIATAELPMEGVTAEDREAAKLMGMSIEEYLKYSKDGE